MATAETVVTGTIGGGALQITPPSFVLNAETGVPLPETVIGVVSGGQPPYSYSLDPNLGQVPNGLELDEDVPSTIGISGTPTDPAGTPVNFGVIVTDAAGATASVRPAKKRIS